MPRSARCCTLEDNFMINRFLEAIGAHRYKTYRIYSKSIA